MTHLYNEIRATGERHYVRAITEPFHDMALGVRVPMIIPRPTVTYHSTSERTITGAKGDAIILTNFANQDAT